MGEGQTDGITADAVQWAYRLFLDREVESEEAVRAFISLPTTQALRHYFLSSSEYRQRNSIFMRDGLSADRQAIDTVLTGVAGRLLIQHIKNSWEKLGETTPHWSVLSSNEFLPENIRESIEAFYSSGEKDASLVTAALSRNGLSDASLGAVIEFGCGVGRVTPFLAGMFDAVVGIDISESHLSLARAHLRELPLNNVELKLARYPRFGMKKGVEYDFWFSRIVLQHNPPPIIRNILEVALAGLNRGGLALFQVPTYAAGYHFALGEYVGGIGERDGSIEMHCIPMDCVFSIIHGAGCQTVEVIQDNSVDAPGWISHQFLVRKL